MRSFSIAEEKAAASRDAHPRKIGADAWFDRTEAANYDVHEQTIRTAESEVLTLVLISDFDMLEEREGRYRSLSRQ